MVATTISRLRTTNIEQNPNCKKLLNFVSNINIAQNIGSTGGQLLLFYYYISMSMFYQVMGATRCPKLQKHGGVKLRPINKPKDAYSPNSMLLYTCETTEHTQTIKCLDNGMWSEEPTCPDPVNNTCPELGPLLNGSYNSSGLPYRVGTVLEFKCDNEIASGLNSTTTTSTPSISTTLGLTNQLNQSISNDSETSLPKFNLSGKRMLKCLASSRWNNPMPVCAPATPESPSNMNLVLTYTVYLLTILVPILIIVTMLHLFLRWRKRQQQRERWKQYFTDYRYRHSKTSIAFGMRPSPTTTTASNSTTIPVTDL